VRHGQSNWSRYTQVQPTFVLSVLVTVHTSAANLFFSQCWSRYTQVQPAFVLSVLVTVHTSATKPAFVLWVLVTVHTSAANLCSLSVGHGTHKCSQPLFCQCWSQYVAITDRSELVRCLTLGTKQKRHGSSETLRVILCWKLCRGNKTGFWKTWCCTRKFCKIFYIFFVGR